MPSSPHPRRVWRWPPACLVGLHLPGRHQGGELPVSFQAELAEHGERVSGSGLGSERRVVAGQWMDGLAGEKVMDGGEYQIRGALSGSGACRDREQRRIACDAGAEPRIQGRVAAAAAGSEVPEDAREISEISEVSGVGGVALVRHVASPELVRDRIPEIIEADGHRPVTTVLDPDGYRAALLAKLVEEAKEAWEASPDALADELADVLEVLG